MAEEQKPKFDLPWGTLLAVIAALAGIVAQRPKPLVSKRLPPPGATLIEVSGEQETDARRRQDPLAIAQKHNALRETDVQSPPIPPSSARQHSSDALVEM